MRHAGAQKLEARKHTCVAERKRFACVFTGSQQACYCSETERQAPHSRFLGTAPPLWGSHLVHVCDEIARIPEGRALAPQAKAVHIGEVFWVTCARR